MTAFFPLGKIVGFEVFALVAKALDDVGVGDAIDEPMIDLIAERFGQTSNFAVAAMGEQGCRFQVEAAVCGGSDVRELLVQLPGCWFYCCKLQACRLQVPRREAWFRR